MPRNRPVSVTLLLLLVLMLSTWGALRFAAALRWRGVLNEFDASLSPLYLSISGAVFCVAGGVLFWGALARRQWFRSTLLAAAILWYCQYWIERLFFQTAQANTGFVLIATTLFLAMVIVGSNLQSARDYFLKSEAHEQADPSSKTE
ncbi:MAG: hypothetical protein IT314_07605 [Anaerolineales bacterium]|nr:hypothetical protein [Anaerolineales bacterium]